MFGKDKKTATTGEAEQSATGETQATLEDAQEAVEKFASAQAKKQLESGICLNCPFSKPIEESPGKRRCRFMPPSVAGAEYDFPVVLDTMWCGQHPKRRIKA